MQITFSTNVFTGPLLSGNSFNDTTDAATFTTTGGGTFIWATHLTTETLTANGSGGWTGSLLESGTDTVASSGETTISAAYTATTGTGGESRKFSYYVRDASGNDSNVITESFTVNGAGYTANAVDLQGTWLASNTSYSGPAASKTGTLQLNIYCPTTWIASGVAYDFRDSGGTSRLYMTFASSGRLSITGRNAAGTNVLYRVFNTSTFVADTWYTITVSWDLAATTCHVYIGDTQITSFASSTTTDDFVEAIGRVYIPTSTPNASWLSEVYASNQFFDLTNTTTRRQFVDASGKPVDKSSVGSPHLYLNGDYTNFEVNAGSGGNLTVTAGSLIAAGSSPTD